jgi:hypothetical protein
MSIEPPFPGPSPASPAPFQFTGETPREIARFLEAYARHEAAAARFEASVREFEAARGRWLAQVNGQQVDEAERRADALARHEAAEARAAARREGAAARDAHRLLREAVLGYVRRLRSDGVPPHHVLITMKTIVRRAAASAEPVRDPETLTASVVEWSIAGYYAA